MSSICSAAMNQAEEAAGYTEGQGSHKICMVDEGPGGTMGNADPEGGNYSNTRGRTVRMCTCRGASTWVDLQSVNQLDHRDWKR